MNFTLYCSVTHALLNELVLSALQRFKKSPDRAGQGILNLGFFQFLHKQHFENGSLMKANRRTVQLFLAFEKFECCSFKHVFRG